MRNQEDAAGNLRSIMIRSGSCKAALWTTGAVAHIYRAGFNWKRVSWGSSGE
jgi:hypothetical protein